MSNNVAKGMKIYALGTGGGPIVSSSRAGISTAICVDGAVYVVDCGMGSIRNYRKHASWGQLRSIFITHHHSDHIYDLGAYLFTGWQVPGESFSQPIKIFGPGKPPKNPALVEKEHVHIKGCCGGDHPMVGTKEMVEALMHGVFASDIAIRMADEERTSPSEWIEAYDIEIPKEAKADPIYARHPKMEPFIIYEDENVKVSTILVDHRLCYPAFGFRFDTKYGSVVISGDTTYSENCIRLARNADVLLHEVIDLEAILQTFPEGPTREGIAVHLEESHTSYKQVGKVAANANVNHLILHHIVPNLPNVADIEKMISHAQSDFDGLVSAAEDNDIFEINNLQVIQKAEAILQNQEELL